MLVINHNWSVTKQRLHPQSVAEISRHSVCQGTGFDNVGHRLGLATRTQSVSVCRHFLLQALQWPCSVQKQFSRDNCCRGRSKPSCRTVGLHTRWELTTWADFQLCLKRLLMSTGCKSSHSGFLDVSRSNGRLNFGDNVDRDKPLNLTLSAVCSTCIVPAPPTNCQFIWMGNSAWYP